MAIILQLTIVYISCGFPLLQQNNEVHDLTAIYMMLSEVCSNVSTGPHLQPIATCLVKLFNSRLQTLTPIHDLTLLLMASAVESLSVPF